MSHYYECQLRELDELNLELYRACRSAHTLLDLKSKHADQIEQVLRVAMNKAEWFAERKAAAK